LGALAFGCAASLGGLFLLRQSGNVGWVQNLSPFARASTTPASTSAAEALPTATVAATEPAKATTTPSATSTATPTPPPTATATATHSATATHTPRPTGTATVTRTATETATRAPTRTPTPTPTPSPTPFVCDSLYGLANIQLAPGQPFQCTIEEQELTDLANNYPDSPCSETRFTLDDDQIEMVCRIGVRMRAVLETKVQDCRVELAVVQGTVGFRGIVQELIATQFDVIRYDTICIDRSEIDDGTITVGGYGR
jgi:hypothetical protein